MRYSKKFGLGVFCAVFMAGSSELAAYEANKDSLADEGIARNEKPMLGEIIVTANKSAEPMHSIPISMMALTGRDIEKSKFTSITDIQQQVPGLTVTQAATGQSQVFIRGIGTDIIGSGIEDAVPVYIDGVYQSRSSGTAMQLLDVDRIEVLKGPQGVLYGRNATGGVINIISKLPSGENQGQYDIQVGSYNQKLVRGTVTGSLSDSGVNGRLSFLHNQDDGDTKNILLNVRGNSSDVSALRGSLMFTPSNTLCMTLNAHYYQNNFTTVFKPLYPAVNPLFRALGATVINDPRTVMQNYPNDVSMVQSGIDAKVEWDLGPKKFTSITALHKTDYKAKVADLDGTEIPLINVGSPITGKGIPEITNFFSQEFTLASSNDSLLAWTGVFMYNHQNVDAQGYNISLPLIGMTTNSLAAVSTDALGIGGEASYSLPSGMRLTAGTRYSTESKSLDNNLHYTNGVLTGSMADKKTWHSLTPKFVVDYSSDKNNMVYASATRGFKSGGYNTNAIQPSFDPETAINYEAGMKSKLLDGKLHLNLAAFYTNYNNMQIAIVVNNGGVLSSVVKNAARAVSKGIEANVVAKPTSSFELSGGLQFLNARFVDFSTINPNYPGLGVQNMSGNPLSRAPNTTANVATQYTWPIDGGSVSLRGEGSYRSKIYFTPFRNDYTSDGGLTLWNVLSSYEQSGKSGLYGAAFVKNLGNKTYPKTIFDPQGLGYLAYYAPARTVGIQAGYRY